MLLELMSNGTLAELPPDNAPDGVPLPQEPSVTLLLPNHKYLLGTEQKGSDKWIYGSDRPGTQPQNVFLYDNETLSLTNGSSQPTVLPAQTVTALRRELLLMTDPPGKHSATVLLLRTFMRDNPALNSIESVFLDEKEFSRVMKQDIILYKAYWTLRFALARGEMEIVARLKAWLKADPKIFTMPECSSRIWFSLQGLPDNEAVSELEELSFSKLELQRMVGQGFSPVIVYNPKSGWITLGRYGRQTQDTMFFVWVYYTHNLWQDLREKKHLPINEMILAVWGEYDTDNATKLRTRFKEV